MSCVHISYTPEQIEQMRALAGAPLRYSSPKVTKRKTERLHKMATSKDQYKRAAAAGNPMLDEYDQFLLVIDPDIQVRSWLARNPNVNHLILERLAHDRVPMVSAFARYRLGVLGSNS